MVLMLTSKSLQVSLECSSGLLFSPYLSITLTESMVAISKTVVATSSQDGLPEISVDQMFSVNKLDNQLEKCL